MTKKPKTLIKELRVDLRHAQMLVRMDTASLKRSIEMAKEIAAKMRALQHAALPNAGKE